MWSICRSSFGLAPGVQMANDVETTSRKTPTMMTTTGSRRGK
jgi:hypothetical protein